MDETIRNHLNHSYDFAAYRKPATTNVPIKLQPINCPSITKRVLKSFYQHSLQICSEQYLAKETKYFNKLFFVENRQSITVLQKYTK